jgi:hypothetical protein
VTQVHEQCRSGSSMKACSMCRFSDVSLLS